MVADRPATFAGRFYPSDPSQCARMVDDLLRGATAPAGPGAIVPHAGWVYSGSTAALGLTGVAGDNPETVVIFGAVHVPDSNLASLYPSGNWSTPIGAVPIDAEMAGRLAESPLISTNPAAHRHEHSIEVQLPLLLKLLPSVRIVPIMVRPGPEAVEVGRWCGRQAAKSGKRTAFVGSTDLTHYGPAFGFEPHGSGGEGTRWAKEVNDRRIIRLIEGLDAEAIAREAEAGRNACGAGAVAATMGAMRELGATRYVELRHTCSAEVDTGGFGGAGSDNSVGYEAGVFVRA